VSEPLLLFPGGNSENECPLQLYIRETQSKLVINRTFISGENSLFELSTELLQRSELAVEVAGSEDECKTVDFKSTAGMQRVPPPAVFW